MEESKERIGKLDLDEQSAYESFLEDGKVRINNCVYSMVPASMTMGEFDKITCVLFESIRNVWEQKDGRMNRPMPPDPLHGPPVEYTKEGDVKRKGVYFICPSCGSELDFVPNDFSPCKCGYSIGSGSGPALNKKRLEEYMEESRKVLSEAVGFDYHTLAIAAHAVVVRIKKLEKELLDLKASEDV